jgi:predicted DNA-binding protein
MESKSLFTVQMPTKLRERIKARAKKLGYSESMLVRQLITEGLKTKAQP